MINHVLEIVLNAGGRRGKSIVRLDGHELNVRSLTIHSQVEQPNVVDLTLINVEVRSIEGEEQK